MRIQPCQRLLVPPPLPYPPIRPRVHDVRHDACVSTACAARASGVHATVDESPDALLAFTGDVSLPNLRLTGCNADANGAVLSISGGAVPADRRPRGYEQRRHW